LEAKRSRSFAGIKISQTLQITHLLFVDGMLIFSMGSRRNVEVFKNILIFFSKATCMVINEGKSSLTTNLLTEEESLVYQQHFPFEEKRIDDGLKYLGFILKPNDYKKEDLIWLLKKLEKRLNNWIHRWLSHAGRLVLVK
jgi:hypothetical protein